MWGNSRRWEGFSLGHIFRKLFIRFTKATPTIYRSRSRPSARYLFINKIMPMDEFLCLFLVNKYKQRRVAELKLLDFLVTLKFFSAKQSRAKIFAILSKISLLDPNSKTQTYEGSLAGQIDEHLIQYFIYCFNIFNNVPSEFVGITLF